MRVGAIPEISGNPGYYTTFPHSPLLFHPPRKGGGISSPPEANDDKLLGSPPPSLCTAHQARDRLCFRTSPPPPMIFLGAAKNSIHSTGAISRPGHLPRFRGEGGGEGRPPPPIDVGWKLNKLISQSLTAFNGRPHTG